MNISSEEQRVKTIEDLREASGSASFNPAIAWWKSICRYL